MVHELFRQAAELIENPERSGRWDQVDVPLLQRIGRLSKLRLQDAAQLDEPDTYDVRAGIDALTAAQLTGSQEITRTWQAPIRPYAGQRRQ